MAELARLIGQEDPFADFVAHRAPPEPNYAGNGQRFSRLQQPEPNRYARQEPRRVFRGEQPIRTPLRAPELAYHREPEPAFRDPEPDYREPERDIDPYEARESDDGRAAYAYGGGQREAPQPVRRPRELRQPYPESLPYESEPLDADDRAGESERHARDPRDGYERPAHAPRQRPQYDDFESADDYADPRQARRRQEYEQDDRYQPDYGYDEQGYTPAHGDEFYDVVAPRRRRTWIVLTAVVTGLLVLGISGVFAYRALFGVGTPSSPRVIQPESGPTKVAPGERSDAIDSLAGKQIQDRVRTETRDQERIVSREERPVGPAPATGAGALPAANQPAAAPTTEPRRVRTMTVRPDGTVVPNAAPPQRPATTPATAPASAPGAPLAVSPAAAPAANPNPPAAPQQRPGTTGALPQQSNENPWAEISISRPSASADRLPQNQPAFPLTQQASLPPAAPAAAPTPTVAIQTPPPAGSYVVQVASQKTETEAQASWQNLQQRYGSVLGNQQATIRRVDLGDRGVFYRAQVGPFSSRTQASELCQNLRAAGGECVIQRN